MQTIWHRQTLNWHRPAWKTGYEVSSFKTWNHIRNFRKIDILLNFTPKGIDDSRADGTTASVLLARPLGESWSLWWIIWSSLPSSDTSKTAWTLNIGQDSDITKTVLIPISWISCWFRRHRSNVQSLCHRCVTSQLTRLQGFYTTRIIHLNHPFRVSLGGMLSSC